MNRSFVGRVSLLLFGSGISALVYQTVWLREFRLVFGASTSASAAVLAVFMAGLGAGSAYLGKRAQQASRPLRFYALLELGIAGSSALTPVLLAAIAKIYWATGGSAALGGFVATLLRLLLAALVLIVPTFLMGGTLPAAARAVESGDDFSRRRLAFLYASNTLGAVTGAFASTFVLVEWVGNHRALWLACFVNALVALTALLLSRRVDAQRLEQPVLEEVKAAAPVSAVPRRVIFAAAAVVGFVFLLMELVWYRMLSPLLGGSSFTFGLILSIALLGIGAGGFVYAWTQGERRPTVRTFAFSCALEGLFVIAPFALGDKIAVFALLLRKLGAAGFWGDVLGWTLVTSIVVLIPALIAGFQFPLLLSLLGKGDENVADDVGKAYAWNTLGAIGGSIAGGFGFLPLMTAPGTWRFATILLLGMSAVAFIVAPREDRRFRFAAPLLLIGIAAVLLFANGPTAAWRHSPIGAGRVFATIETPQQIRDWMLQRRRAITWEADGIESSIALSKDDGFAFVVNGKSDGHVRFDAGTQIMSGILSALLHPSPKRAMVIGLGTGSTAGWLAMVPSIEKVDVVEIEPAMREIAQRCELVNGKVLKSRKCTLTMGDAREFLVARGDRYDIIFSEPSNPFRAGIASLFTTDFYRAVGRRLEDDGLFVQWLQGYEVDTATVRTVYASLTSVFPSVETWQTQQGDLLLIGTMRHGPVNIDRMRQRIEAEPFRSALLNVWRVDDVEGVLAHFVAGDRTSHALAKGAAVNTDDHTIVEFAFARSIGKARFKLNELKGIARVTGDDLPFMVGLYDRARIEDRRFSMVTTTGDEPFNHPFLNDEQRKRLAAHAAYAQRRYDNVLRGWAGQQRPPEDPNEILILAEALADRGEPQAEMYATVLERTHSIEAAVVMGRLRWRQRRYDDSAAALVKAFVAYRKDPWPLPMVMERGLDVALAVASEEPTGRVAGLLHEAVREPFAMSLLDDARLATRFQLALRADAPKCGQRTLAALTAYEPNIPWQPAFLEHRSRCYSQAGHPLAKKSKRDLEQLRRGEAVSLASVLAERR